MAYFDLGDEEGGRLLVIIHHLAVDGVSWRILLEDLQRGYEQVSRGEVISLGAKSTSWREWGEQLQRYVAEGKLAHEEEYWLRAIAGETKGENRRGLVGESEQVVVRLAADETRELLQEVPRLYATQITEVLLWALVEALGEQRLVVEVEGHGREELDGAAAVDLTRTVGWFTSLYPLALEITAGANCAAGLKQVQAQVRAVPQRGMGYGLLKYLSPNEQLRRRLREGARARMSFNYLGQVDTVVRTGSMFRGASEAIGNGRSELNERHHELEVNGSVRGGELVVSWTYSGVKHERAEIEAIGGRYMQALRRLVAECRAERAERGYSVADFPLARLDQGTLTRVVGESRDVEDIYPLTPLQQGMLFHSVYEPESGVGYEQVSCRLEGELNVAAFARAWAAVVQRHTILRTAFIWEGINEPLQVVRRSAVLPIQQEDWRGVSSQEQEQRLEEYLKAERERGIDPAQAPLMRLSLLRLGDARYQLVWSHHHLLLDGWCVSLIFKEVLSYYDAFRHGEQLELAPARPYREYIAWLQRQDQQVAEQYWREQLRGFTETTQLGLESGRSNGEPAAEGARLSEADTAAWEQLAREQQLTLSAVVQGAWALLLSRYSGKPDVVYGVTVSGRPPELAGVETMLGLFINVLPVRVQVAGHQTVLQWLQEITEAQFRRQQYEYVSGLQVQEWSEVGMGQPLFESLCLYENYPLERSGGELERTGLRLEGLRSGIRTKYGLTLAARKGRVLELSLQYQSGRYQAETMRQMLAQLQQMLEAMVARPEQQVSELEWLTAGERRQLLEDWNGMRREYEGDANVVELFEDQVELQPDAVALEFAGEQLSYAELSKRANQLGHYLRSLGVRAEVRVGICVERSVDTVVGVLGTLKAGGAYVLLEPEQLQHFAAETGIAVVLTQEKYRSLLNNVRVVSLDTDWERISEQSSTNVPTEIDSENLACICYTQDSSGEPAALMITHHGLSNYLQSSDGSLARLTETLGAEALAQSLNEKYVLRGAQELVPVGVSGELCLGGAGMARGYLGRADLTADLFVPHPYSTTPGARLFRTRDVVRYLPDGTLEYPRQLDQ